MSKFLNIVRLILFDSAYLRLLENVKIYLKNKEVCAVYYTVHDKTRRAFGEHEGN